MSRPYQVKTDIKIEQSIIDFFNRSRGQFTCFQMLALLDLSLDCARTRYIFQRGIKRLREKDFLRPCGWHKSQRLYQLREGNDVRAS